MSAKRKSKVTKLPDKPSALIRLALRDLEKAEKSRLYVVDMGQWHSPQGNNRCAVCLAGSVMAMSLRADRHKFVQPIDYSADTSNKLQALDWFRLGSVVGGLDTLGKKTPRHVPDYIGAPDYDNDRDGFKRAMRSMATMLAKHGC